MATNKIIVDIQKARLFLLNIVDSLSVDELNETPAGFNNNIIWNIGHIVYAQQGICYVRSGLPIVIEEKYFREYKSGTKPEHYVDETEVQKIKDLILFTSERLASDYEKQIFTSYSKWTTRYDVELGSIDDAITFLLYHEGLHAGVVMALKKLVNKTSTQ